MQCSLNNKGRNCIKVILPSKLTAEKIIWRAGKAKFVSVKETFTV
jgi:hypothetical protein